MLQNWNRDNHENAQKTSTIPLVHAVLCLDCNCVTAANWLLRNNPRKMVAIEGYGLSVTEWLPLEISPLPSTLRYLTSKRDKLGHVLRGL